MYIKWHFLLTSSDTFAVGSIRYIVQPQHAAENQTAEFPASGIAIIIGIVVST